MRVGIEFVWFPSLSIWLDDWNITRPLPSHTIVGGIHVAEVIHVPHDLSMSTQLFRILAGVIEMASSVCYILYMLHSFFLGVFGKKLVCIYFIFYQEIGIGLVPDFRHWNGLIVWVMAWGSFRWADHWWYDFCWRNRLSGLKFWFHCLLVLWTLGSSLTSLCLSSLICKIRMIIISALYML